MGAGLESGDDQSQQNGGGGLRRSGGSFGSQKSGAAKLGMGSGRFNERKAMDTVYRCGGSAAPA